MSTSNRIALMAIVPDPEEGQSVRLDCRSTAIALVFAHPLVGERHPDAAREALSVLEDLEEIDYLEDVLFDLLEFDTFALHRNDEELNDAYTCDWLDKALTLRVA